MAAQENHDSVVKYLLSKGANQTLATEVCTWFYYFSTFLNCSKNLLIFNIYFYNLSSIFCIILIPLKLLIILIGLKDNLTWCR